MDNKSDLIKEDIDETRNSLTEKLGNLEAELRGQVETAKTTVEDTIEGVRESVRKFTPTYQFETHPLLVLGGTLATGFVVGRLLNARRGPSLPAWNQRSGFTHRSAPTRSSQFTNPYETRRAQRAAAAEQSAAEHEESRFAHYREALSRQIQTRGPSLMHDLANQFGEEIEMVKGLAIGALLTTARDLIKQAAPNVGQHVDQVIDSALRKFHIETDEQKGMHYEESGDGSKTSSDDKSSSGKTNR